MPSKVRSALGVQQLFSGFQFDELPAGFNSQLTGCAVGEQAHAPSGHHPVDDLDIDGGLGFFRSHAQNLMGMACQKLGLGVNLFSCFQRLIPA